MIIKIRLISIFTRSQPGKQRVRIHILPNISRSKVNQIIKFGQLIETFFLKNYTQNVLEKLFPDPVLKSRNWAYLWANSLKFCFHCVPSWRPSKYMIEDHERYCIVLTFTLYKAFSKNKKRSWISCFYPKGESSTLKLQMSGRPMLWRFQVCDSNPRFS